MPQKRRYPARGTIDTASTAAAAPAPAPAPALSSSTSASSVDSPGTNVSSVNSPWNLVVGGSPHSFRADPPIQVPPTNNTDIIITTDNNNITDNIITTDNDNITDNITTTENDNISPTDVPTTGTSLTAVEPSNTSVGDTTSNEDNIIGDFTLTRAPGNNTRSTDPTTTSTSGKGDPRTGTIAEMFAELDILRAQANNFQTMLESHRSILSASVTNIEDSLQTLRSASQSNHDFAMRAMDIADACHIKTQECQDAQASLRHDIHSVQTLVQDFIDGHKAHGTATSPPAISSASESVEEAFAAADAALQEGLTAMENELGDSLDRNINARSSSTPTNVRFANVDARWSSHERYDSEAAYARAHSLSNSPPNSSTGLPSPSLGATSTRTLRRNDSGGDGGSGGGGGGDGGGGSPNSYGDALSPRHGGPNSPRHRNALMRNLHPDILLWHAGGPCGDPVDGCDFMEAEDVEVLDITPGPAVDIAEDHFSIIHNWDNPRWMQKDSRDFRGRDGGYAAPSTGGPQVSDILKQISNWDKLSDLSPTGWQAFYNKLRRFSVQWKIALVPFDAINLKYESAGHGLCTCGLGLARWKSMGDALFIVLEYLLPTTNAIISTSVESIANGSSSANGYELLWILLKEFIPMLDRSKPAVFPSWPESDDIFQFARLILMFCTLSHHRGPPYSEALKSRMFLTNVRGRYATLATQYSAMVGSYCPGRDGVTRCTTPLPIHLTVMELARTFYDLTSAATNTYPSSPSIQAFHTTSAPQVPPTINHTHTTTASPPSLPPSLAPSATVSSITDEATPSRPMHLQGFSANTIASTTTKRRSAPDPSARNSRPPRSKTPRHEAPCEACGKYGHPAVRCDMLAMALYLQRYCADRSHAETIRQNEHRWVERNKQFLPRDDRSPRLILANYCAEMNFSEDQVDNELDWDYLYAPSAGESHVDE